MNRYQIYEVSAEKNHAGSKATADVKIIAEKYGYSGPDSVKTQKSKCIKKLRPLIEKFIKL